MFGVWELELTTNPEWRPVKRRKWTELEMAVSNFEKYDMPYLAASNKAR